MDRIMLFLNSPVGPKTVHFWGPAANWGIVLAAMMDANKPVEKISTRMTATLFGYSCMFMRFAWMVQPRNMLLFACHASNATCQLYLLGRVYSAELSKKKASVLDKA